MNYNEALKELKEMIEVGGSLAEAEEIYKVFAEKEEVKEPKQIVRPYGIVLECQHCHKEIRTWYYYCPVCGGRVCK